MDRVAPAVTPSSVTPVFGSVGEQVGVVEQADEADEDRTAPRWRRQWCAGAASQTTQHVAAGGPALAGLAAILALLGAIAGAGFGAARDQQVTRTGWRGER